MPFSIGCLGKRSASGHGHRPGSGGQGTDPARGRPQACPVGGWLVHGGRDQRQVVATVVLIELAWSCRWGQPPFGGYGITTTRDMRECWRYNADDAEVGGHGSGHYRREAWYRAAPDTVPMKAVQQQCCTLGRVRPAPFGLMPEVAHGPFSPPVPVRTLPRPGAAVLALRPRSAILQSVVLQRKST